MNIKPKLLLLVFAGGAIGTFFRALTISMAGDAFGIFVVNMVGTAFLAWFNAIQAVPNTRFTTDGARVFWGAGFAGGFTTMSSLALWTVTGPGYGPFALILNALVNLVAGVLVYSWVFKSTTKWTHHKIAELKIEGK
ncbi:MAG: fluoride efflux transporter FluC [Micrococcales bacterium]